MILVDSSVWIDHLRASEPRLQNLLQREQVLSHPAVVGEIALGRRRQEDVIILQMSRLLKADVATHEEVLHLIRREGLGGSGIGYADAHLLASTRLTVGAKLWTRDRSLHAAARRLDVDADIEPYGGFHED